MRPKDSLLAHSLNTKLLKFEAERRPLSGISDAANRRAFLEQLLESVHRVDYVKVLRKRDLTIRRADPKSEEFFDPLKAAVVRQRQGEVEEAFWLVFLFVHFGKGARAGWRYAREVYGRLGDGALWDWASTSANPAAFRGWLYTHQDELKRDGVPRGFGNHRKYESLDPYSQNGTGAAVESYVGWVHPPRTHRQLVKEACEQAQGDPRKAFDILYQSMRAVARFGRTARFDYLTMIGKLGLAPIVPGSAYIQGSTGPAKGARLLFGTNSSATELDSYLVELDAELKLGMQVLEDALCNWQKSPTIFKPFRG